jgi:hypothetical protein
LPHSFFFVATIVDLVPHRWMRIGVTGDFHGYGDMEVTSTGEHCCEARLRWITTIEHPYLRPIVRAMHPVFEWNHKWSMRATDRMMQAEIARRRATPIVAPPKAPTFPHNIPLVRDWQRRLAAQRGWRV